MAQHFLLSAAARSLSLAKVMRMSDTGWKTSFLRLRWPKTDGKPVCPHCGCSTCYSCRRMGASCAGVASVPSRLLAHVRNAVRLAQAAAAELSARRRGVLQRMKGKSMLALARDLDVQYKTAFVVAHKLREAMAASMRDCRSAAQGGWPRSMAPISAAMSGRRTCARPDRSAAGRKQVWQTPRRRGDARARGPHAAAVFAPKDAALASIGQRILKGTTVHADESRPGNPLHARFPMKRINHQLGYSIGGACTNGQNPTSLACAGPNSAPPSHRRVNRL